MSYCIICSLLEIFVLKYQVFSGILWFQLDEHINLLSIPHILMNFDNFLTHLRFFWNTIPGASGTIYMKVCKICLASDVYFLQHLRAILTLYHVWNSMFDKKIFSPFIVVRNFWEFLFNERCSPFIFVKLQQINHFKWIFCMNFSDFRCISRIYFEPCSNFLMQKQLNSSIESVTILQALSQKL